MKLNLTNQQAIRAVLRPHTRSIPRRIHMLHTSHWISDYPKTSAFLLAYLFFYIIFALLTIIRIRDYTSGIWPLFN